MLTEIVSLLTDNEVPISTSLLKIKVMASRLRNDTLFKWINKELSGYQDEDDLPKYRIHGCNLVGNYMNGHWQFKNQVLATLDLPEIIQDHITKFKFYQSISVLESYLKEKKSHSLKQPIPTEILGLITNSYQRMGNPYLSVYSAYKEIGYGAIEQIMAEVRNITLDMMLKLEDKFGFEIKLEDLLKKKEAVNHTIQNIMNQINISNEGDGNVINTGSKNSINNRVNITKKDFEAVRKLLKENKVDESDINDLEQVIDEKPDYENKLFGSKVNKWIQNMTFKALNGTWKIGIGAAGTLLGEILKQYYGM